MHRREVGAVARGPCAHRRRARQRDRQIAPRGALRAALRVGAGVAAGPVCCPRLLRGLSRLSIPSLEPPRFRPVSADAPRALASRVRSRREPVRALGRSAWQPRRQRVRATPWLRRGRSAGSDGFAPRSARTIRLRLGISTWQPRRRRDPPSECPARAPRRRRDSSPTSPTLPATAPRPARPHPATRPAPRRRREPPRLKLALEENRVASEKVALVDACLRYGGKRARGPGLFDSNKSLFAKVSKQVKTSLEGSRGPCGDSSETTLRLDPREGAETFSDGPRSRGGAADAPGLGGDHRRSARRRPRRRCDPSAREPRGSCGDPSADDPRASRGGAATCPRTIHDRDRRRIHAARRGEPPRPPQVSRMFTASTSRSSWRRSRRRRKASSRRSTTRR